MRIAIAATRTTSTAMMMLDFIVEVEFGSEVQGDPQSLGTEYDMF